MADVRGEGIPEVVSHFRVAERLGSGGMGAVYKGYDRRDDSPVAIKFLHSHLADDPSFRERFEREAHVASLLTSRYTVHLLEVDETGGRFYIVMEYVEGHTLKDALGATLYHMLAGRPPFSGTVQEMLHLVPEVPPPRGPLAGQPAAVVEIIIRCLAKEPDERYQTAAELSAAIERASRAGAAVEVEDETIVAQPDKETAAATLLEETAPTVPTGRPSVSMTLGPRLLQGAAIGSGLAGAALILAVIFIVGLSSEVDATNPIYFATPLPLMSVSTSGTIREDSFEDPESGLLPLESDSPGVYEVSYEDGEYVVKTSGDVPAVILPISIFRSDSLAEIDVTTEGSPPGADRYYGIACRSQPTPGASGYRVEAHLDGGKMALVRLDDGVGTTLAVAEVEEINSPDRTNRLGILCDANRIAAVLDGEEIMAVEDGTYESGGGYAWLYFEGPTTVRFDDLLISRP